jgi:two-component sensor histidine kinase
MPKPVRTNETRQFDDAILSRIAKQAWFHRYPRGWPFILFVIVLVGTAASVIAIERADQQAREAELDRNATEIASGLERRAAENTALLRAAAALISSRTEVTPAEFTDFAGGAFEGGDEGGALGIGWAPLIPASQISMLEARERAQGAASFVVRPAPTSRDTMVAPVVNVVPLSALTRPALGFDLLSSPERRMTIEQASRLGRPITTPRVRLVPTDHDQGRVGFVIVMPVLRWVDGRRRVTGIVFSAFRAADFLDAAAEPYRGRDVETAIYDGPAEPANLLAMREVRGRTGASIDRRITIAGREWTLRVNSKRVATLTPLSRATLVFGILLGLLVMFIARVITRHAVEDRNLLEWLTGQAAIRTQLTRELNHRVKNTLANVLSIVALTRRRSSDIGDFADSLTSRLRALSATHDILSQSDWTEAAIGEIVRSELAPYLEVGEGHIEMSGPRISLAPNDALSLGLAIHELATNAAKYGALSTTSGRIAVDWLLLTATVAEVRWRETGGPPVAPPTRRGFGLDLIEKVVAHELRSNVELDFAPEGVRCVLRVPVRRSMEFTLRQPAEARRTG